MGAARVAPVTARRDLERSDPGRDGMKGAPDLGLEAGGARLALEAEAARQVSRAWATAGVRSKAPSRMSQRIVGPPAPTKGWPRIRKRTTDRLLSCADVKVLASGGS